MKPREWLMLSLLGAALIAVAVTAYGYMDRCRLSAIEARAALDQCVRAVRRIEDISRRPIQACDRELESSRITALIEQAAKAVRVVPTRIAPEQPQAVEGSSYREKPTRVFLDNVSLQQVVDVIHRLAVGEQPLAAKSLRLSAVEEKSSDNLWKLELVVTYLIYDPASSGR